MDFFSYFPHFSLSPSLSRALSAPLSLSLPLARLLAARRIRQSQPSCFVVASIVVVIKAAWRAKRYSSSSKVPESEYECECEYASEYELFFLVCFLARIVAVLNCNYSWRCVEILAKLGEWKGRGGGSGRCYGNSCGKPLESFVATRAPWHGLVATIDYDECGYCR